MNNCFLCQIIRIVYIYLILSLNPHSVYYHPHFTVTTNETEKLSGYLTATATSIHSRSPSRILLVLITKAKKKRPLFNSNLLLLKFFHHCYCHSPSELQKLQQYHHQPCLYHVVHYTVPWLFSLFMSSISDSHPKDKLPQQDPWLL